MVDQGIIQAQYQKMTDAELVYFARNNAANLTVESFLLLKTEFEKRDIDFAVLELTETDNPIANFDKQTRFKEATEKAFTKTLWQYALDAKEQGISNAEISTALVRKGMSQTSAEVLVSNLKTKAKTLMDDYDTFIIISWICFFTGVILFILISNRTISVTFGIYGLLMLIISVIGGLKSSFNKKKYQTVLHNIEVEEKDEIEPLDADETIIDIS
jgi:hypothetical protein